MSLATVLVPPLDPNLFTGPSRLMGGIARMAPIVLDTPYGTNGVTEYARWIYVGTTGNLTIIDWAGNSRQFMGIAAGIWHPIYSLEVTSSGTTASNLLWGS